MEQSKKGVSLKVRSVIIILIKEVSNTQSIRRQAAKAKTIGLIGSKKRAPLNINYKNYPVNFDDIDLTVVK